MCVVFQQQGEEEFYQQPGVFYKKKVQEVLIPVMVGLTNRDRETEENNGKGVSKREITHACANV